MSSYDIVIKNGRVINPENNLDSIINIGIKNNTISAISSKDLQGSTIIDASNKIVSPGFIDIHGHLDGNFPFAKLSLLQGITTSVGGNCGISPVDLKEFFNAQQNIGFPINQAELVGHSFSLRNQVGITNPYIAAEDKQFLEMQKLAAKAFEAGAMGLSFGLEYAPGTSFKEVIALSKIAADYGGIIPIHTNLKGPKDLESLKEAIKISEITGAAVQISHFVYQYGIGIMTEALEIVDKARNQGLNISVDSGMYTAFSTGIGTTVYDEISIKNFGWKFENLLVASGKYTGERLTAQLYKELRATAKGTSIICYTGVEAEIYEALLKDYVMVSTDAGPSNTGLTKDCHPQNSSTFPRFFNKMVTEQKSLALSKAVEKCTLLPAKALGLKNKGRISVGADADIVIFDIASFKDNGEFPGLGAPDAKPTGMHYAIVNGKIAVENGNINEAVKAGSVIKFNT